MAPLYVLSFLFPKDCSLLQPIKVANESYFQRIFSHSIFPFRFLEYFLLTFFHFLKNLFRNRNGIAHAHVPRKRYFTRFSKRLSAFKMLKLMKRNPTEMELLN